MAATRCASSGEGGNNFFSIRITSSPARRRDRVSGSLTALLAALDRALEAGAEMVVHPQQSFARPGCLFVARLCVLVLAVLTVGRAARWFTVSRGHRRPRRCGIGYG